MQREDRLILRDEYLGSLAEAIREAFSRASVYSGHRLLFVAKDANEARQVLARLQSHLSATLVHARRFPRAYLSLSNSSEIWIVSIDQLAWSLCGMSVDTLVCQQAVWGEADLRIGLTPLLAEHHSNSVVSYGVGKTCAAQRTELRRSIVEAGNGP